MKLHLKVVPWSKQNSISEIWEDEFWIKLYKVKLKEKPIDWKANISLIDYLWEYFNIPKRNIKIITWLSWKDKIVEILF